MLKEQFKDKPKDETAPDVNKSKLLSVTYNNFACIFKRRKDPESALKFLNVALKAEEE